MTVAHGVQTTFFSGLLIFAALCSQSALAIVDGEPVQDNSKFASFTVGVRATEGHGKYAACTGVLIASDAVLTAAHCVYKISAPIDVFFGKDWDEESIAVTGVRINPSYNPVDNANDLAVLKLRSQAPLGHVPLRIRIAPLLKGTPVTILGYGFNSYDPNADEPQTLNYINLVVERTDTTNKWINLPIGASGGNSHGDSGGPLIVYSGDEIQLAGICSNMSLRTATTMTPYQGNYVWVAPYLGWLQAAITQLRAQSAQ